MTWHLISLSSLSKVGGDQPIDGPRVQKVEGDRSPPVPMVVAPIVPYALLGGPLAADGLVCSCLRQAMGHNSAIYSFPPKKKSNEHHFTNTILTAVIYRYA